IGKYGCGRAEVLQVHDGAKVPGRDVARKMTRQHDVGHKLGINEGIRVPSIASARARFGDVESRTWPFAELAVPLLSLDVLLGAVRGISLTIEGLRDIVGVVGSRGAIGINGELRLEEQGACSFDPLDLDASPAVREIGTNRFELNGGSFRRRLRQRLYM